VTRTQPVTPCVEIEITAGVTIEVDEIWPDGDAPDPVTAEEVRRALEHRGPKPRVLMTWGRLDDATVTVSVTNPHWNPTAPLLPEHAPARHQTTQVWAPVRVASPTSPAGWGAGRLAPNRVIQRRAGDR
jgi:hypothetical protein